MKKIFVLLLAALLSILSIGNLYANSCVGHNTVAIYCIWRMSQDPSFMPQITGSDREELTHPDILKCEKWDEMSNAQQAFLEGANLPDCPSFMKASHNLAPMEVLSAMYMLKDFCPPNYANEPEEVKAFIIRMHRFMTWGSKLHIEMDKITHSKLPYAGNYMAAHVYLEDSWDEKLFNEIFEKNIKVTDKTQLSQLKDIVTDGLGTALKSRNHHYGKGLYSKLIGFDLRDNYVDFILGKFPGKVDSSYGDAFAAARAKAAKHIKDFEKTITFPVDCKKEYPSELTTRMINLVNTIDLTTGPTLSDINNQYNIDLPEQERDLLLEKGELEIKSETYQGYSIGTNEVLKNTVTTTFKKGPTDRGQQMLKAVYDYIDKQTNNRLQKHGKEQLEKSYGEEFKQRFGEKEVKYDARVIYDRQDLTGLVNDLRKCVNDFNSGQLWEDVNDFVDENTVYNLVRELLINSNWNRLKTCKNPFDYRFMEQIEIENGTIIIEQEEKDENQQNEKDENPVLQKKHEANKQWTSLRVYLTKKDVAKLQKNKESIQNLFKEKNLTITDDLVAELLIDSNWERLKISEDPSTFNLSQYLWEYVAEDDNKEEFKNDVVTRKLTAFGLWSILSPYIKTDELINAGQDSEKIAEVLKSYIKQYQLDRLAIGRIDIITNGEFDSDLWIPGKTFLDLMYIRSAFTELLSAVKDINAEFTLDYDKINGQNGSESLSDNAKKLLEVLRDPGWLYDAGPFYKLVFDDAAQTLFALKNLNDAKDSINQQTGEDDCDASNSKLDEKINEISHDLPPTIQNQFELNGKNSKEVFTNFDNLNLDNQIEQDKVNAIHYVDYIPEGVKNPNYFIRFRYDPPLIKKDNLYSIYLESDGNEGNDKSNPSLQVTTVSICLVYRYPERANQNRVYEPIEDPKTANNSADNNQPAKDSIALKATEQEFFTGLKDKSVVPDMYTGYPNKVPTIKSSQKLESDSLKALLKAFGFPEYMNFTASLKSGSLLNVNFSIDSVSCLKGLSVNTSINFDLDAQKLMKETRDGIDQNLDSQPMLQNLHIFTLNGKENLTALDILEHLRDQFNKSLRSKPVEIRLASVDKELAKVEEILEWGILAPKLKADKTFFGIPAIVNCLKINENDWELTIKDAETKKKLAEKFKELLTDKIKALFANFKDSKVGQLFEKISSIENIDFDLGRFTVTGDLQISFKEFGESSIHFSWNFKTGQFDSNTKVEIAGLVFAMSTEKLKLEERLAGILKGLPIKIENVSFKSDNDGNSAVRDCTVQFDLIIKEVLTLKKLVMTGKTDLSQLDSGKIDISDIEFDFSNVKTDGSLKTLLSNFIDINSFIYFTDPGFIKDGIVFNIETKLPFINDEAIQFCQVTLTTHGVKFDIQTNSIEELINSKINQFLREFPQKVVDNQTYLVEQNSFDKVEKSNPPVKVEFIKDESGNVAWPIKLNHIWVHAEINGQCGEPYDILDPKGIVFRFAKDVTSDFRKQLAEKFEKAVKETVLPPFEMLLGAKGEFKKDDDKPNVAMLSLKWDNGVKLSVNVTAGVTFEGDHIKLENPRFFKFDLKGPKKALAAKLNDILPTDIIKVGDVFVKEEKLDIPIFFKNEQLTKGEEIKLGDLTVAYGAKGPEFRFLNNADDLCKELNKIISSKIKEFLKKNSLDSFGPLTIENVLPGIAWTGDNKIKLDSFTIEAKLHYSSYDFPCKVIWEHGKFSLKIDEKDSIKAALTNLLQKVSGISFTVDPINGSYRNGISIDAKCNMKMLSNDFAIEVKNLCITPHGVLFPTKIGFTVPNTQVNIPVGPVILVLYEATFEANFPDQKDFMSLKVSVGAAMTVYQKELGNILKFNSKLTVAIRNPLNIDMTADLIFFNTLPVVSGTGSINLIPNQFNIKMKGTVGQCFGKFFKGETNLNMFIENSAFKLIANSKLHALGHDFMNVDVSLLLDFKHFLDSKFEFHNKLHLILGEAQADLYIPLRLNDLDLSTKTTFEVLGYELASCHVGISLKRLELGASVLWFDITIKLRKIKNLTPGLIVDEIKDKIKSLLRFSFSFRKKKSRPADPDACKDDPKSNNKPKTGEQNTGEQNTGEQNTGEQNTGEQNTGGQKTGEQKTGEQNTGGQKTGEQKTGEQNTGSQKTGEESKIENPPEPVFNTKGDTKVYGKAVVLPGPEYTEHWGFDEVEKKFGVYSVDENNKVTYKRHFWYKIPVDTGFNKFEVPSGAICLGLFQVEKGELRIWETLYARGLNGLEDQFVLLYVLPGDGDKIYGRKWTGDSNGIGKFYGEGKLNCIMDFFRTGDTVTLDREGFNHGIYFEKTKAIAEYCEKTWATENKEFGDSYATILMVASAFLGAEKMQRVEDDPPLYTWKLNGKNFLAYNLDAIRIDKDYDTASSIQQKAWKEYLRMRMAPDKIYHYNQKNWPTDKKANRKNCIALKKDIWPNSPAFAYISKEADGKITRRILFDGKYKDKESMDYDYDDKSPISDCEQPTHEPPTIDYQLMAAARGYICLEYEGQSKDEKKPCIYYFDESGRKYCIVYESAEGNDPANKVIRGNVVSIFGNTPNGVKCVQPKPHIQWTDNLSCKKAINEIFTKKFGSPSEDVSLDNDVHAYRVEETGSENGKFEAGYVLVMESKERPNKYSFIPDAKNGKLPKCEFEFHYKELLSSMRTFPFESATSKAISPRNLHLLQTFQIPFMNFEYLIENEDKSLFIVAKWKDGNTDKQQFFIVKDDGIYNYPVIYYKWADYSLWDNYSPYNNTPQSKYHWNGFSGFDSAVVANNVPADKKLSAESFKDASGIYLRKTVDHEGVFVRLAIEKKDSTVEYYRGNRFGKYQKSITNKEFLKKELNESFVLNRNGKDINFFLKNLVFPNYEDFDPYENWDKNYGEQPSNIFFRASERFKQNTASF